MKLAVFALIAGLCLVAVTANATGRFQVSNDEVDDFEYMAEDFADEIIEFEPYGIFSGMLSVLKASLRTLKGINCTIKEVLLIKMAAQNFLNDMVNCGGEVSKKVQNLINACNDILKTCAEILSINESICGNSNDVDDNNSGDSNAKTSRTCFSKLLRKMRTLKKQIKNAVDLIKKIKDAPAETGECAMTAVITLENQFIQFPEHIKICSKLTS